ncbi:MAG TPA: imidazole glycerol phosphate synthase subunit HisH [Candidatus Magasanikbacteria bacterium]|nr:imidazole glycerol phosphate synthase subunit HisH [Candidatus Magasanikbacteria bacterium]
MIAIINYQAGNITSVANALNKLGVDYVITADKEIIRKADKIIFPGQGRAGQAIKELKKAGLIDLIKNTSVPFLGICLGLQILATSSDEDNTRCLGIIPGTVKKFSSELKIPQIGWNKVNLTKRSFLTQDIPDSTYFYFVHSYYLITENKYIIGKTNYDIEYPTIINKNNFYATQFHPEKSGDVGLKLLNNFCKLC